MLGNSLLSFEAVVLNLEVVIALPQNLFELAGRRCRLIKSIFGEQRRRHA